MQSLLKLHIQKGNDISMEKMVKRSDKKAFYGITGDDSFTRVKYFTEMSISKNPKEYTRQYMDEDMERTDVVGFSPSLSFSFDEYTGDPVLEDIVGIIDDELLGVDARRDIVIVNFAKPVEDGYEAVRRTFSIIADSEGDSTDAYTYSGTMKAVGPLVKGVAKITGEDVTPDEATTITFTEV